MLGVRFSVCERCDTVHAAPDERSVCTDCGAGTLRDITRDLGADAYFTGPLREQ